MLPSAIARTTCQSSLVRTVWQQTGKALHFSDLLQKDILRYIKKLHILFSWLLKCISNNKFNIVLTNYWCAARYFPLQYNAGNSCTVMEGKDLSKTFFEWIFKVHQWNPWRELRAPGQTFLDFGLWNILRWEILLKPVRFCAMNVSFTWNGRAVHFILSNSLYKCVFGINDNPFPPCPHTDFVFLDILYFTT